MLDIKKRKILIILSVLVVVTLIIAFFVFDNNEEDLNEENNNIEGMIMNQRNSNSLEDLVDGSGNIEVNIVNRQNQENNEFIDNFELDPKEIDSEECVLSGLFDTGDKKVVHRSDGTIEKEYYYTCYNKERGRFSLEGNNNTKVVYDVFFYDRNSDLEKSVHYFPQEDYEKTYYFTGIDGTRPIDNKVYENYLTKNSVYFYRGGSYEDRWRNELYKVTYYEDGKTKRYESFYKPNVNDAMVEDYRIDYYENGAIQSNQNGIYKPNGELIKPGKEVFRRSDGSIEREEEWLSDYVCSRRENFYYVNGNKEKEIIDYSLCINSQTSRSGNRYYEERLFRNDGSLERITKKTTNNSGNLKTVITSYDLNNILRNEEHYQDGQKLDIGKTYNIYDAVPDFIEELNRRSITAQQRENAIKNAELFLSLCNHKSNGFGVNPVKWAKDVGYLGDALGVNGEMILGCGVWDFFGFYATSEEAGKTIFDKWENRDFYDENWFDKYGYVNDL